jgi:hypothetical protein
MRSSALRQFISTNNIPTSLALLLNEGKINLVKLRDFDEIDNQLEILCTFDSTSKTIQPWYFWCSKPDSIGSYCTLKPDRCLFPSVYAMWKSDLEGTLDLPCLVTHASVIERLRNGAGESTFLISLFCSSFNSYLCSILFEILVNLYLAVKQF